MKNSLKKFNVILLALSLFLTIVVCACSKNNNENIDQTSSGGSAVQSTTQSGNGYDLIDRSKFSIENLKSIFSQYNMGELEEMGNNGQLLPLLSGYKLGDIVNSGFSIANNSFPAGSNIGKLYGFSYYSDGNWYNNSTGKKSHKVMNQLLNYNLDNSVPLEISQADIEAYGNSKIIDFAGYTASATQLLNSYNPFFANVINGSLNQWNSFLTGNYSQKIIVLHGLAGDSTLNDFLKIFTEKVNGGDDISFKDALSYGVAYSTLGEDVITILVAKNWLNSESANESLLPSKTLVVDGISYTVETLVLATCNVGVFAENEKFVNGEIKVNEHIEALFNELQALYGDELNQALTAYSNEFLSNPNSGELTLGVIQDAISLSDKQMETALLYTFDVLSYVDSTYGEDVVVDGLTLSDVIYCLNSFLAGSNDYQSVKISELSAFINGLKDQDLTAFAKVQIEDNKEFIEQKIAEYSQTIEGQFSLTYDKILELSNQGENQIVLSEEEIACLKTMSLGEMLKFNQVALEKTNDESADKLIDELLTIDVYDLIYGLDSEKSQKINDLLKAIEPFSLFNTTV